MPPHEDLTARARQRFEEVPWRRLVGIGDSIIEGELSEPSDGYPELGWYQQVAETLQELAPGLVYKNLAKRYLKTAQILETQLQPALDFEPDVAVVACGGNDMLVEHFDVKVSEDSLEALLTPMVERGVTVFVATMYDIFSSGAMAQELRDMLEPRFDELRRATIEATARTGAVLIDLYEHPVSADPTIYTTDLQHCTRKGHGITAEIVLDHMADHVAAAASARASA